MKNNQPPEKMETEPAILDVQSIFYTIQGEGPHTGRPATFIRLAGCNMQCPLCDTDYTSNRKKMTVADIVEEVSKHPTSLIIISGGEPFRQNIKLLVDTLHWGRHTVQVETNGTFYPVYLDNQSKHGLQVVICPKTRAIHKSFCVYPNHLIYYKYVMEASQVDPEDGLPTNVLGYDYKPARPYVFVNKSKIYLQPVDSKDPVENEANLKACVESCLKYGYRLCLQTHKIARLP
jgi:7-carboxy-7-deazaguanine synthase